jgi:hypothetical protein
MGRVFSMFNYKNEGAVQNTALKSHYLMCRKNIEKSLAFFTQLSLKYEWGVCVCLDVLM